MLDRRFSVFLLLLTPAVTGLPGPVGREGLSEICQFVREEQQKILDSAFEGVYKYEEYLTEWRVDVPVGQETAHKLAERLGFINYGPVLQLSRQLAQFYVHSFRM